VKSNIEQQVTIETIEYLLNDKISDKSIIQPIPLTPEILEKCGFVPNAIGQLAIEILGIDTHLELVSIIGGYCYLNLNQVGEFGSIQDISINRIQHLHQLQNLYYALTGEELIYQP
jgi:hypothetical protein